MNWGYKILTTIIIFVVGMLGMVYISMRQTNEMLDDNYYTREQEYQTLLDAEKALNALLRAPLIVQDDSEVTIQLPEDTFEQLQNGSVVFLKPDDKSKDASFVLSPDASGKYKIGKSGLARGMYKVRVKWENGSRLFYSDDNFFIL